MIDIVKIISEYEGGYSNVPGDLGGETYAGISRKYNPDWQGWETLDLIPQAHKTTNAKFIELTSAVDNFYTDNYIKKYSLNSFSDELAAELFDNLINRNATTVITEFQTAINALNDDRFEDLITDGNLGSKTIKAANLVNSILLTKMLNILQGAYYINRASDVKSQRKFIKGWLSRVVVK